MMAEEIEPANVIAERGVFRIVAGVLLVSLVLFGTLQLMDVIHI